MKKRRGARTLWKATTSKRLNGETKAKRPFESKDQLLFHVQGKTFSESRAIFYVHDLYLTFFFICAFLPFRNMLFFFFDVKITGGGQTMIQYILFLFCWYIFRQTDFIISTIQKFFPIWISRSFKKVASDNTISYFDQSFRFSGLWPNLARDLGKSGKKKSWWTEREQIISLKKISTVGFTKKLHFFGF